MCREGESEKRNLGGEKNFLFFISCGICLNEARHVIVSFDMNLWCIHVNKNVTASRVGKLWAHNARKPDRIFSFHSLVLGFTLWRPRFIVFETEDDLKKVKPIAWEKRGWEIVVTNKCIFAIFNEMEFGNISSSGFVSHIIGVICYLYVI